MEMKEISRREVGCDKAMPCNRIIIKYEIDNHYEVKREIFDEEKGIEYISIKALKSSMEYLPDIFVEDNPFDGKVRDFLIQTTSYGALSIEEIKKVINGLQYGLKVTELLKKKFVKL